ncbi:Prenyltransferase and squalene oxidase repeat protein [compost metagenome]
MLQALGAYQNEDGGFGHALEPDMRCPESQPVATEVGLLILSEVQSYDTEIFERVLSYLKSITMSNGGLPRSTTQVNAYPHAPWWTTEQDGVPSINPTGSIVGMLMAQNVRTDFFEESWFRSHISFLWKSLEANVLNDYHDAMQWIPFLEHVEKVTGQDTDKVHHYRNILDQWLRGANGIERNEHAEGYVHKVLDYVPEPQSYASRLVTQEEVTRHLEWLISTQQDDGGWGITFPSVSAANEQEWRGWLTLERLKILKAYGVL